MRAFVAVPLDLEGPAREEDSAPHHLTLRFLGEVPESSLVMLEEPLRRAVVELPGFEIVVEGVGAFPSADRPRVVWRGVGKGEEPLRRLAAAVREAVHSVGLPEDSLPFSPHVTLFRVRSGTDRARARSVLEGSEPAPPPSRVWVREIHLMESRLTRAGATHRIRARFALGSTVG